VWRLAVVSVKAHTTIIKANLKKTICPGKTKLTFPSEKNEC
jgi:hypothetical protein